MNRHHQPDQADFKVILPKDIDWKPFPAFPPGARLAIMVGHPAEPGPYVVRVKLSAGAKLMPHKHPEDRIYTVMSGVFYIGLGETFDGDKVKAYPPGSVVVLPGDTWHFHWAKAGEYVTQVTAIGRSASNITTCTTIRAKSTHECLFSIGHMVSRMREAERSRFDLEATIYRGGFDAKRGRICLPRARVLELILILTSLGSIG